MSWPVVASEHDTPRYGCGCDAGVERMTDLVTFGETVLRLTPPGHERVEDATQFECRAAGPESNTAIAAEKLGAVSTWMSKLPDNPLGRRVVGELRRHGIGADVVWSDRGRQGTVYMEHAGEPRRTKVIPDREDAAITNCTVDQLDAGKVEDARAFYTTGVTPALSETLRETTVELLKVAHDAGTTTAMDLNYRSSLWSPEAANETLTALFPAIDVLVTAARDAETVLGYDDTDPNKIAHTLASKYDFETVVVTKGERGAIAWHDNVIHEHDDYESETVNPFGATDALTGAFLARRMAGDDIGRALEYGAATAAIARTLPGDAVTVTREEVEDVIGDKINRISR
ncbi:MAG: 2-dehydro-3-deoxygluconokinase [Halobacteriales archaeon]|jgi:2-dehydro-3-deoxygluconokinase